MLVLRKFTMSSWLGCLSHELRKAALSFFALVFFAGIATAGTYAFRNEAFIYDAPSASASTVVWHNNTASPACTSYPNGDDDWADIAFPAGFTFTFAGQNYSSVRVNSNGILTYGTDTSGFHRNYSPSALPITTQASAGPSGCPRGVPQRLMLPYWIDIVAGTADGTTGASIKHELLGVAPNRRLVISWVNVKLFGQSTRYNFQVALYESAVGVDGNFQYRYSSGSSNGANATVGVQVSGSDFIQYSYNQQFIDTTTGTLIHWYPANQLTTKRAEYRFEESVLDGSPGEVKDTSGSTMDARSVGSVTSFAEGRLCRAASFPSNTSNAVINAIATPIAAGTSGSVGFWYRSNTNWNSGDAMLLDASQVANRPFFLMKQSSGALRFAMSDSAGLVTTVNATAKTFAANTWHHIGISWNIRLGTNQTLLQIFIDGELAGFSRSTTSGTPASFNTFYIGDNRTSGVTPTNGTPNGANGIIDEVYIYAQEVSSPQFQADMALTASCTFLDHFRVIHEGAVGCGAALVTIEAHNATHAFYRLAGVSMTIATSTGHGTWSAVSAINPVVNTGPGTATYTFANESRVVFALTNPHAESVNINVASGVISERTGVAAVCSLFDYTFGTGCDSNLVFGSCVSKYECLESAISYSNIEGNPAARNPLYTKVSGQPFTFDVVALDANGERVSSYASDANKTVTVELVNSSVAGGCSSLPALSPAASASLTFQKTEQATNQGRKTVSFTVGKAYENLRCRITDNNISPAVVGCSSDNFAIRPGEVSFSGSSMATPPSAAATPTLPAGKPFLLTANTSTSAADGYVGELRLDATKLLAQNVLQDSYIESGGKVGTLSSTLLNANQSPSSANSSYTEVGYLYLAPGAYRDDSFTAIDRDKGDCLTSTSANQYLATNPDVSGKVGCSVGNTTNAALGRFRPDHFDTEATPACGIFTYSGQPFNVRVKAKYGLTDSMVTENYMGVFSKPITISDANMTSGNWYDNIFSSASNGVAGGNARFEFSTQLPAAPATLLLQARDSESVSSATGTQRDMPIRFGRLRLSNIFGAVSPLRMPIQTQYWTGKSWVRNTDDLGGTCTPISSIVLSYNKSGWPSPALPSTLGSDSAIAISPNSVDSRELTADLSALPWLKSRWRAPFGFDQNPSATATFGIQSPETRRAVHVREQF